LVLALAVSLGLLDACRAAPAQLTLLGRPADAEAFINSMGVDVHLGYAGTAYARRQLIFKRLKQLGIHHIRDQIAAINSPVLLARFNALARIGIRDTLIAGAPNEGPVSTVLRAAAQLAPDLDAIEGPNEWDLHGGPTWVASLRAYQRELYRAVKASPVLRRLPVLAPSVLYGDAEKLGNVAGMANIANGHPYALGGSPQTPLFQQEHNYRVNVPHGPLWVTETGYQTDRKASTGQPESLEAGLILRTYLEYFTLGVQRTFVYELADEVPDPKFRHREDHFGLLNSNLSPKPAFTALRNLVALLKDPGPSFRTPRYVVRVSGDTTGVRTLKLAKRNGSIALVLWRRVLVWNTATLRAAPVSPRSLRIELPGTAATVRVFAPTHGSRPVQSRRNVRSLQIGLGRDPEVVMIRPR
jgi:hypothetical protein